MFAVAKRAAYQTMELKSGRWTRMENVYLQGKRLGVVGTGNIGSELARLANALGMEVVAWSFHPSEERGRRLGVRYVEMDELLATSDVVSLNVALTDETRGMIGEREIGLMKPGALLVNGGRGRWSIRRRWCGLCTPAISEGRPWTCTTWSRCPRTIRYCRASRWR